MRRVEICPSMLASDFGALSEEAKRVVGFGADRLHLDIMDGLAVKDFGFSPYAVRAIRREVKCPLDVHLMICHPEQYVETFVEAGASAIVFQMEIPGDYEKILTVTKSLGVLAGVALAPKSPLKLAEAVLSLCDVVVLMSIEPGTAGSYFMPGTYDKIQKLRDVIDRRKEHTAICVDGGIGIEEAAQCMRKGADWIVSGSGIFKSKNPEQTIMKMRGGLVK